MKVVFDTHNFDEFRREDIVNRDFVGKLKRSFIIRMVLWPIMIIKKKLEYIRYQKTEDHLRIKQYKDIYKGQRCFVIGNGPSLRADDLDRLKKEITFGTNGIYNIFSKTEWRPNYYLACDVEGLPDFLPRILPIYTGTCFLSNKAKNIIKNRPNNVIYALMTNQNFPINTYDDKSSHISEDVSKYFSRGYTVTFDAIQLAIYMGFKEIYLLGVDFNYALMTDKKGRIERVNGVKASHFNENKPTASFLNYFSTLYAYEAAEKYCKEHGIKICNATRGGKLEVFERVDFDNLF